MNAGLFGSWWHTILLLANIIITPKDNNDPGTMPGVVVRVIIAVLAVLEQ